MKKIVKYLGKLMTVIAIVYIVHYIYSIDFNAQLVKNWPAFIGIVCGGTLTLTICVFGMGKVWSNILKGLTKQPIDADMALKVYVKANIGKYLPGNVMHYVERNLFAVNAGMGQMEIALSSILEIGIEIFTAGVIAFIFMYEDVINILSKYVSVTFISIAVFILIILVCIAIVVIKKKQKIREILVRLCSKHILFIAVKNVLFYSILFFVMGALLVAVLKYPLACEISSYMFGHIIASYILAWVIGFVVPGAPGGIGVREFVLITLLGSYFSEEYIVFAMVTHRLLTVFGDLLAYLIASWGMKDKLQVNENKIENSKI